MLGQNKVSALLARLKRSQKTKPEPQIQLQPNSRLLCLPGELLNNIAALVLDTETRAMVTSAPETHLSPCGHHFGRAVRQIPHPLTQTCRELRHHYPHSETAFPFHNIRYFTARAVNSSCDMLSRFAFLKECLGPDRVQPEQFTLVLKIDSRWYFDLFRPHGLYGYECMAMPVAAKVVYEIDLSGISDPWVFVGMVACFKDGYSDKYSERAWENLYQSARKAALVRMRVTTWHRRARVSLRGLLMVATWGHWDEWAKVCIANERKWLEEQVKRA